MLGKDFHEDDQIEIVLHSTLSIKLNSVNPIPGGGGGGGGKTAPLANFFNFLKIGKSYSFDVLGLLVFILWPHFPQFSCIYTSLTKSYEHFVRSTRMFSNIFNILLTSALSCIHCCKFFYFYCVMLYSVCLLSEK